MTGNRHILSSFIATLVVALSGCATTLAPDDAVASGPFSIDERGRFIARLSVNGRADRPFIVDTAASISAVYKPYVELAGLEPFNSSVTVHGLMASGQLPLVLLPRLEFDRARWTNRSVVQLPAAPTDERLTDPPVGILGHDILASYGVEFSIAARTLRFYSPETLSRRHYAGWTSVPLTRGPDGTPSASIYFLNISIEGQPVRAVFDLGSGVNMVNWRAARSVGLERGNYARASRATVGGILDETGVVPRFVAGRVNTGAVRWREEVFGIEDLTIFATLGLGDGPAALLGAGLFAQRDFVIDLARHRVLIRTADEAPAAGNATNKHIGD